MSETGHKESTSLATHISKAITWRHWCMRATSCPVPFLKASFPFIGGHSLIEVICIILLFAISIVVALSVSFEDAGSVGDVLGALTTLLGLRNNLLNLVLGISYERALFWHKVVAVAFIVAICIHIFVGINGTGIVMIACMIVMSLAYFVKNQTFPHAFEVFYYTHVVSMFLLAVAGIIHGSPFIAISGALWIIDVVLRSSAYFQTETITAKATQLPGEVIKLTFERPIKYGAGQYAFLRIPEINKYEFHPFSFSSCPQEGAMAIHIRELGDWTTRLGDVVRAHDKTSPEKPLSLEVMVDGAYGSHMINLDSPDYQVFLLISGGIGITPNQSLYNSLISQADAGRSLRKVFFVWSVKDKALVTTMTPDMLEASQMLPEHTPLSFQPGMIGSSDKNYPVRNPIRTIAVKPVDKDLVEVLNPDQDTVVAGNNDDDTAEQVFEKRFYLTRVRSEEEFKQANIDPVAQPWLKFGRPDIAALFAETRDMLVKESSYDTCDSRPRVAVSVCGPAGMVAAVQDLCRQSQSRGSKVLFDCHAEVFDM